MLKKSSIFCFSVETFVNDDVLGGFQTVLSNKYVNGDLRYLSFTGWVCPTSCCKSGMCVTFEPGVSGLETWRAWLMAGRAWSICPARLCDWDGSEMMNDSEADFKQTLLPSSTLILQLSTDHENFSTSMSPFSPISDFSTGFRLGGGGAHTALHLVYKWTKSGNI